VRRLTNRQVAVLAAVERLGNPSLPELRRELSGLDVSAIYRDIDMLERRGILVERGSPPRFVAVPRTRGAGVAGPLPAGD
jgi:DNA-binding MarR family transcriptional regulator